MGKVNLDSGVGLSFISRAVSEVKDKMQDDLTALNTAFDTACERWQDKNAQTCMSALNNHCAEMRLVFERLSDFENALNRLSELALLYENI